MKDDLTPEQKERLQQQDEFLGDVKKAAGDKKGKLMKVFTKVNDRTKMSDQEKADWNEKQYREKKKKEQEKNKTNTVNPKYQSPMSEYRKDKPLDNFSKTVNSMDQTNAEKIRKVFGK